ncbi:hypothetical protein H6P81_015690 [Aristolochia fimbriata]|uniref:Zinc finger PHD-type domain-containing protein n=1 Tax=Aristolochia fimbriata TaxID=158543 RepID=A0AAV7E681_ARIFI|nr:hypothetical protein H6P81_015690 [Aristolochia fimbriata]
MKAERRSRMETVCQKCGAAGYTEYLIFCKECKLYAEHSYCSDTFPSPDEDEDVAWICEECSQLFATNPVPPRKLHTFCNMFLYKENMISQLTEDEGGGEQFPRKKRRLILEDSSDEETDSVLSDKDCIDEDACKLAGASNYVYPRPIINPIWRYCRLAAHLSNKVTSRVFEVANRLESRLCLQKLPRTEAWPKSFSLSPPTEDDIALYFLPESQRDDFVFNELLDEVNRFDLVLTAELDNAQLLLFSSFLLPKDYWRFCGKCYIWGVFRGRQLSSSNGRGYPKLTGNHDIGIEDTSHLSSGITVGGTDGTASVTFPTERALRKSSIELENLTTRESSSQLSSPCRSWSPDIPLMMETKTASNAQLIKSVEVTQDSNRLRVTSCNCEGGFTSCYSENISMTTNDLELFPLKAESMAVPVVQGGGNTVLPSLELGLRLCGEEQHEKLADGEARCDLSVQIDSNKMKLRNEKFDEIPSGQPTLEGKSVLDMFKTSEMVEGTSMKDQLVKMMKHLQDLGNLGMNVYLDSQKNIILGSLPKWFEPYATNFFMNNPDITLNQSSVDLEKAELHLKKNTESVAMTQLPGKKLCGRGEGQRGNRAAENWSGFTDKFSPEEENTEAKRIRGLLGSEEHHKDSYGKFGFSFPAQHDLKVATLLGENHNEIPSQQPTLEGQSVEKMPWTDNMLEETSMKDHMVMLKKYDENLGKGESALYQHLVEFEGAKQCHLENLDGHVPSPKHTGEELPLRHTGLGLPADEDCPKEFTGGSPGKLASQYNSPSVVRVEGLSVLEKFKTTKMVGGSSVKDHMVKMIKYVQDLRNLGINVARDVQRKVILSSLLQCFEPSATKFFMQNHNFTLAQLLVDLEAEELRLKKSFVPIPLLQRKWPRRRKRRRRIAGHKRTDVDESYKSSCNLSPASSFLQSVQVKQESQEHRSVANPKYKVPTPGGRKNLNKSRAKFENSLLEKCMPAKMVEGTPVKVHMIKMMKYLQDLGKHGTFVSLHMQRRAILSSLPDYFKRYAEVFFSRNPTFTLTQLLVELEVAELNMNEEITGHSSSIATCVKQPQTAYRDTYIPSSQRNFKPLRDGGYKRSFAPVSSISGVQTIPTVVSSNSWLYKRGDKGTWH